MIEFVDPALPGAGTRLLRKSGVNRTTGRFETNHRELKKIIDFIFVTRGMDLSSYRQSFIYRRLWSRMSATESVTYTGYGGLLESSPLELDRLLDALSINVSEFFRNPEVFAHFKKLALSELVRRKEATGNKAIRVWSAGCSTGQETYSLAIVINEQLEGRQDFTVRIWGTDIDKDALEKARKAEYSYALLRNLDKEIIEKHFVSGYNDAYVLTDGIRRMVRFEEHNLITDPPLKHMDVIFCRNMMIYLTRPQQETLFKKFFNSLKPGGYMVLGQVEVVWDRNLFKCIDPRRKIYQKPELDE